MSDEKSSKRIPDLLIKTFTLVGGLKLVLKEPTQKEILDKTNIQLFATMLQEMKGDSSYTTMPMKKKEKILSELNIIISTAFMTKMNEFINSDIDIEREDITEESIISSLFNKNTLERKITFSHEDRVLDVVISSPITSFVSDISDDLSAIATYCIKVNDKNKDEMSEEEWKELIGSLPYLLSKNILPEYENMFDTAKKFILNEQKLDQGIKNF